jgi:hypothetical protein
MGITEDFYQQMVNTEPSSMVIYRASEYTKLIPRTDPVSDEIETARRARGLGITTFDCAKEIKTRLVAQEISVQKNGWTAPGLPFGV